jgi:RND family efflux transporter MFP subunit
MSPDPARPAVSRRGLRVAAFALALAAFAIVASGLATRHSEAARLRERTQAQAVRTVAVIAPASAGAAGTLRLPGRIEAHARAPIYARVSGYLKRWVVDIGAHVKAGQLLAEIETPDLDQQLLQAQAQLATARANAALASSTAARWQSLLASNAVARQEVEEKVGDLAAKQSVVHAAQANVERFQALKRFTRIVAPFDGVVTARSTDVGALITAGGGPGSELFVVSDTSRLRVYVNLPQSAVPLIRPGAVAQLSVPGHPGRSYRATVRSMAQAVNAGSMLIQLAADNTRGELLPGGFATVSFEMPRTVGALSIPPSALIFDQAGLRVATVGADGKVALKPVTILRDLGSVVELASGLSADDRVIESPPDGIDDGDAVRIAAATAAPAKHEAGGD